MEFLGVFPISQRFFCTYDDTKQLKNHEENYTNFYKKKATQNWRRGDKTRMLTIFLKTWSVYGCSQEGVLSPLLWNLSLGVVENVF